MLTACIDQFDINSVANFDSQMEAKEETEGHCCRPKKESDWLGKFRQPAKQNILWNTWSFELNVKCCACMS
jgi:hypothetical protein